MRVLLFSALALILPIKASANPKPAEQIANLTAFLQTLPSNLDNSPLGTAPSMAQLCEGWWETYWSCANVLNDLGCSAGSWSTTLAELSCYDAPTRNDARKIKFIQIRAYQAYSNNDCSESNDGLSLPMPY